MSKFTTTTRVRANAGLVLIDINYMGGADSFVISAQGAANLGKHLVSASRALPQSQVEWLPSPYRIHSGPGQAGYSIGQAHDKSGVPILLLKLKQADGFEVEVPLSQSDARNLIQSLATGLDTLAEKSSLSH